jgi:pimeloyl-ACP methyl ester carboxylesterase
MEVFEGPIVKELLAAGFRVLGYDFLAHGWSHADNKWLHYEKEVFLTQLSELLDHVLAPGEPVDLWVGHSTGGIIGVMAALSEAHPIRDLALISPAFWANKPLIARVADKIPNFMHGLVSSVGPLKKLPQDAYLENNDVAFGKYGNKYLFPTEHIKARQRIQHIFQTHPQSIGGIMGIATYFLREDLIEEWRVTFKGLAEMKGQTAPRVCLLWGKFDVVVPFSRASEVMAWASGSDRFTLVELQAGHESPVEDPSTIAREIVKFASVPARM